MHRLRSARHLARLVLAWFALALLVAVASPLLRAEPMELVCTSVGAVKLLPADDGGPHDLLKHTLDCPLCAGLSAPPPVHQLAAAAPVPLSHVLRPIVAAHLAWLTAAPLPARGPPSFS